MAIEDRGEESGMMVLEVKGGKRPRCWLTQLGELAMEERVSAPGGVSGESC